MILAHHGKLEFGSPKLPMTPEAMLLSALDDLEAKFQALRERVCAASCESRGADRLGASMERRCSIRRPDGGEASARWKSDADLHSSFGKACARTGAMAACTRRDCVQCMPTAESRPSCEQHQVLGS